MIARGKIAWFGILVLALLVMVRGENVPYRVWTTRSTLAIEERKDQRAAVENEISGLPTQRAALVTEKEKVDRSLSVLREQNVVAQKRIRGLRKRSVMSQREEERADREARAAQSSVMGTYRKSGDRTLTAGKLLALLRTGKRIGLPAVLVPLVQKMEAAQAKAGEERTKQKGIAKELREALKAQRSLDASVNRLVHQGRRLGKDIGALDRRKVLLNRRLAVLSRPGPVIRAVAPQPTAAALRASASLSGSVGDATTPLIYTDLSRDQATLDTFLSRAAKTQKKLEWPVSPAIEGISAYYHDELYVAKMGQDHFAIDIVVDQGTEIVAPADALVLKAEDSGTGFQYILLLHKNGYMTFYGHVSSFGVDAGDLIRRGAIIGESGGKPGTSGAGKNTTGPHLHFEVWKDNKRLDPLLYLDLGKLPRDPVKVDPDQVPSETATDLDS